MISVMFIKDAMLLLEIESNDGVRKYRNINEKIKFGNSNKRKNVTRGCE